MSVKEVKKTSATVLENRELTYVDNKDPIAYFLRNKLHLNWISLWVIALIYFGFVEKIIVPSALGFLNIIGVGLTEWVPHVEALLTGFVEFPIFLAFYLWSGRGVAELFESLSEKEVFDDQEDYRAYISGVFESMRRRVWLGLSIVFAICAVLAMNFVFWGENAVVPPWFGPRTYFRIWGLFNIAFVAYAIAQVLIREILVIYWLGRLWREKEDQLVLHPYHYDGAGGLGDIGKHAVTFFFFILVLLLFIIMAIIIPEILKDHPEGVGITVRFWSPLLFIASLIYLVIIPFMFVLMIWPAHKIMVKKRDARLSIYSKELDNLLSAADSSASGDHEQLPAILDEIEKLRGLRKVILDDYPTWPIDTQSKLLFGITSSVPTAYSAVSFVVRLFL
jgi:hypothetical protein